MKKKIIIAAVIACALISSIAIVKYFMREKVPEGCVYIENGGKRYEAGERMPSVAGYGDEFITEDYIYTVSYGRWAPYHWQVEVKDKTKEEYEPVLEHVNDDLQVRVLYTFQNCVNLRKKPEIPESVEVWPIAFDGCLNLK